jgi:cobalamin synthase
VSLRNAFAHLTALRVPPRGRIPLLHSIHYFPLFGAALGSLNILCFLAVSRALPNPVACLFAVLLPQALAGFAPWRGVAEATQGAKTRPGYGFAPGFRPDLRGGLVASLFPLGKWIALLLLPGDWQVRAVFVFPILGMCARTWAFLREPPGRGGGGLVIMRRRIRAGFLSLSSAFLVFLFSPATALASITLAAATAGLLLALRHPRAARRRGEERKREGLTLQSAALVSEATEAALLVGVVLGGLFL